MRGESGEDTGLNRDDLPVLVLDSVLPLRGEFFITSVVALITMWLKTQKSSNRQQHQARTGQAAS